MFLTELLVETEEGRVFTICKHRWLFVCLAPDESLLNGLEGGSIRKNPYLKQGLMMTRIGILPGLFRTPCGSHQTREVNSL